MRPTTDCSLGVPEIMGACLSSKEPSPPTHCMYNPGAVDSDDKNWIFLRLWRNWVYVDLVISTARYLLLLDGCRMGEFQMKL